MKNFGAVGDGVADDTQAIQQAIHKALNRESRYATPPFILFPSGTYRVSRTLEGRVGHDGWSSGWRSGLLIMGENKETTTIQLADGVAPDPKKPVAVISTGSEEDGANPSGQGNRAFRHFVSDLTIDTGKNNPGAVGVDFLAHNRGSLENLRIRSGDGQGVCGILMLRRWPGPALIKGVSVEGFDYAVDIGHYQYSMTFEHMQFRGQKKAAVRNPVNGVFMRRIASENSVPFLEARQAEGLTVLVDSDLKGGHPDNPAIHGPAGAFLLRNVLVEGYGKVSDRTNLERLPKPGRVEEFVSDAVHGRAGKPRSLGLPIEETPEYHNENPEDWMLAGDSLQAAIDSGKSVVYLPNRNYALSETLVLRGNVRKIIGAQSSITVAKGASVQPLIRFEEIESDSLVVEHLWIDGVFEHDSSKAIAFRHCDLHQGVRNTPRARGKLFLEDIMGKPLIFSSPLRVWGRQVNAEFGGQPLLTNRGADLWILGLKTEGSPHVLDQSAGRTEILGGLIYPLHKTPADVAVLNIQGGEVSASWINNGGGNDYPIQVMDGSRRVERKDLKSRVVGLYSTR